MRVMDVLSTRTKQRLILAARAADKSRELSHDLINAEFAVLDDDHATGVEMCTGVVSGLGQRALEIPIAFAVGIGEFFRRR